MQPAELKELTTLADNPHSSDKSTVIRSGSGDPIREVREGERVTVSTQPENANQLMVVVANSIASLPQTIPIHVLFAFKGCPKCHNRPLQPWYTAPFCANAEPRNPRSMEQIK